MSVKKNVLFFVMMFVFSYATFGNDFWDETPNTSFQFWCHDTYFQLDQAKASALQATSFGDYEQSVRIMLDELNAQVAAGPYVAHGAFTYRALVRGVALTNELLMNPSKDYRFVNYFILSYVDFIKNSIKELDFNAYKNTCHGYCNYDIAHKLEAILLNISQQQLELVLDTFTVVRSGVVYPLGDAKLFLLLLEKALRYSVSDLSSGMFANVYACTIAKQLIAADKIKLYLATGAGFPNEYYAVQSIYHMTTSLIGGCTH